MKRLREFFTFTPSEEREILTRTMLSCLTLWLLWVLANVVGDVLGGFSFFTEPTFGVFQWLVLRRYIRHLGWWVLASAGGCVIVLALIVIVGIGNRIAAIVPGGELEVGGVYINMQGFWTSVLVKLLAWTVIGVCQWLVLRLHIQHSSWWVLASTLGGVVKGAVEVVIGSVAGDLLGTIMGALVYGVVTGSVLVLLLHNPIKHRLEHRRNLGFSF